MHKICNNSCQNMDVQIGMRN